MAKSGRKRAKAEKAKTHLRTSLKAAKKPKKKKDGIRLAKGLNETKVDVASLVRTVAVRGQDLGEDKSVYVEHGEQRKRLRDVAELTAKLGHHAHSQRVDGLTGLQDWVRFGGGVPPSLLGGVAAKSLALISDPDAAVRRECARFLGMLLQNTPQAQTSPYPRIFLSTPVYFLSMALD